MYTNYVSENWGESRPPLPPFSANVSIFYTPPSPFISQKSALILVLLFRNVAFVQSCPVHTVSESRGSP